MVKFFSNSSIIQTILPTLLTFNRATNISKQYEHFLFPFQYQQFSLRTMAKAIVDDSLPSSHPVYQPVNDPNQIGALFDHISYDKVTRRYKFKFSTHIAVTLILRSILEICKIVLRAYKSYNQEFIL